MVKMTYCFRIRCNLSQGVGINSDESEWMLFESEAGERVTLVPGDGQETLGKERRVVIRGKPYDSAEHAEAAGRRWMAIVQRAFARMRIGADFGERAGLSVWTEAGLATLSGDSGQRVLNDVHGLSVFTCEPDPVFAGGMEAAVTSSWPGAAVQRSIEASLELGETVMTGEEQTAYDLFSASCGEATQDARFMMLMMALETLIVQEPRAEAVRAHVAQLKEATKNSGLPRNEQQSLLTSLGWLEVDSINQAGQRLARTVGDRQYMEGQPEGTEDLWVPRILSRPLTRARQSATTRPPTTCDQGC